jgi:hypothetical protein
MFLCSILIIGIMELCQFSIPIIGIMELCQFMNFPCGLFRLDNEMWFTL